MLCSAVTSCEPTTMGVHAVVGVCAVGADTLDVDVEESAGRRDHAVLHAEAAHRHARRVVHCEDRIARKVAEQTVLDHRLSAADAHPPRAGR